ncbi:hypothetical protein [Streptomyces sp. AcE210]|nr:hypothetical protein [Streptomyces sp. AcE210]
MSRINRQLCLPSPRSSKAAMTLPTLSRRDVASSGSAADALLNFRR